MKALLVHKMVSESDDTNLVIVRIRGITGVKYDIDDTLNNLRLFKKNYCVVIPKNFSNLGMVRKVKDYVTWGEIDKPTFSVLVEKRGEKYVGRTEDRKKKIKYNSFIDVNGTKIKKIFKLNSPKKGYGRKGIKIPFNSGGALGYRGDKIKDLIMRMI